ncbi:MAG: YihY/virulence factor BrkB family protein [Pyrinomonadaceae bacterium]|nr:YihY/virulence factor BrkB family protein [Pyrinomonadaceae bacterium]
MDPQSPWKLGGLTWQELGKRVYAQINADDVFGRAAQLAYYFLLALFPLLIFLTTILGYLAETGSELQRDLLSYLSTVLPPQAATLIDDTLKGITEGASGSKLSFGILATLWTASNGMGAISSSLNVAYNVEESRPWWKVRLTAIGLTVALAVLIISALGLIFFGHDIAEAVANKFGLGTIFTITWKILQWPIVLAFVLLSFALIYYMAPDIHDARWQWITPGAGIGVALWLIASFAFKIYLEYFDSYSATYGSLGAVIVLMLWFYITGVAILIGGEINSEIENAAAEAGKPDAKERGEKSPGEKSPAKPGYAKQSRGQADKEKRRAKTTSASVSTRTSEVKRTSATGSHQARTNQSVGQASVERKITVGKIAVVAGAWVLSKFRRTPQRPG